MPSLPAAQLVTIRSWVFDDDHYLIGVVVEEGERWAYREFEPADRLALPVPIVILVRVLRRYIAEEGPAARKDHELRRPTGAAGRIADTTPPSEGDPDQS